MVVKRIIFSLGATKENSDFYWAILFLETRPAPHYMLILQKQFMIAHPKFLQTSVSVITLTLVNDYCGREQYFDVYPDRLKYYRGSSEGITLYSNEASPFGFNGGYCEYEL